MARQIDNGKWILERGEPQWLAWREWWLGAFRRHFWPDNSPQTSTISEWPPETFQSAAACSDFCRSVDDKPKPGERGRPWDAPVNPEPWVRWSASEQLREVEEFRDRQNPRGALGPKDAARIEEIMQMFKAPARQKPPALGAFKPEYRVIADPNPPKRDYDLAAMARSKANGGCS